MLYTKDSLLPKSIAALLGCQAGSGLRNDLNDLARSGVIVETDTVGLIFRIYLSHKLHQSITLERTA